MKKITFIIFFMLVLCGCGEKGYSTTYFDVFDTVSTLTVYTSVPDEINEKGEELHKELIRLNKLFDIYNSYDGINNIKTINDNAGIAPVKVDNEIIELVKAGKEAYQRTNGTINIAMGSVLEIWHNYRDNALNNNVYAVPSSEELAEANKHTDVNSIIIDEENSTIFISDKDTSIDVGAIAKGYAADYAADFLKSNGITSALLNLGGNVICINDDKKESWKIGIVSPDNPEEYMETMSLSNQSAVSSGNYQRYYEYDGTRYHHIIDGKTLSPAQNNKAITIVADSSLEGDIFSTALFILSYDEGKALADENNIQSLWVTNDGNVYKTSSFITD